MHVAAACRALVVALRTVAGGRRGGLLADRTAARNQRDGAVADRTSATAHWSEACAGSRPAVDERTPSFFGIRNDGYHDLAARVRRRDQDEDARFEAMHRSKMTARVVPLTSPEAGDSRMGGTVDERVRAVAELTALAWRLSGRPLPTYSRETMPVVLSTLSRQTPST